MAAAVGLLFLIGVLGGTDILLYHSLSHGIRQHADSRGELWLHALRGPTYAALFLVLPNWELAGAWLWALFGLFALDAAISIVDFALEGASREALGGLPAGEYVLHMLLAMAFGGIVTAVALATQDRLWQPAAIVYRPVVGPWLQAAFAALAVGVFWSGWLDARAAWRLSPGGSQAFERLAASEPLGAARSDP